MARPERAFSNRRPPQPFAVNELFAALEGWNSELERLNLVSY